MNQPLWSRILESLSEILQASVIALMGVLRALFGTTKDREIKRMAPTLKAVRAHEAACVRMSNSELRAQTARFKERLAGGESLDDILPEAFAVVCEAAKRVTGMRLFDVQVLGGIVLHRGSIAEMVTGEGKTLVATMPMYLNALAGQGVHLVTVNDYLARRDCEWMGPIFEFLGLTVGLIQHDMGTAERQVGYRADITYGTNNEFGFDYLRDNMAVRPENRVQRGLNYAIVDEIDSILVDEARTPLIISGRPEKSTDMYFKVDDVLNNRRMRKDALICWAKDRTALADSMRVHVTAFKNSAELVQRMGVRIESIGDPRALARALKDPKHAVAGYLREHLEDKTLGLLDEYDGAAAPAKALQNALMAELREAAHDDGLYAEERFAEVELSEATRQALDAAFHRIDLARLNLNLLKDAFPGADLHPAMDLDPMADYLRRKMPEEALYLVDAYPGSGSPSRELQAALMRGLGQVLHDEGFFSEERFAGVSLPETTRQAVRQRASARDLAQVNRLLLEAAFPGLTTGPDLSADPLAEYIRGKLSRNTLRLVDACDGSPEAVLDMEKAMDNDLLAFEPRGDEQAFLRELLAQERYQDIFAMDAPYSLEEKGKQVVISDGGMLMAERLLGVEDLFVGDSLGVVHMVEQGLRAHHFYKRDDEYVVRNGEVLIVDEFTGRMMEGRRYSDGLHQAIEAKERVPVQFESQTVASITYQNYFKLYAKIAGMTGTAATEGLEFAQIYNLDVVQVPTNLPLIREDMTDLVFATEQGKFRHVVNEIVDIHEEGRPILVGTVSIEKSELLAKMLQESGVDDFQVLNAKHHGREAAIVANAGKRGAITIATNMAGRGTDIKLGEGVRELGGLAIVGTERHDSRRIDDQLRGRCGRQGDPGTTRFFLSLEDEVARLFGGDKVKRLLEWTGSQQEMDEQPLGQRVVTSSIRRAQKRVEEYNFEIRKHVKEYDDVMNRQRQIIYQMRRDVLEDRDVTERLRGMFENIVGDLVSQYASDQVLPDEWELEALASRFKRVFGFEPRVAAPEGEAEPLPIADDLLAQVLDEYKRREEAIAEEYRQSFRAEIGGDDSRVDFAALARKRVHDLELMALLRAVDDKWIEHLYSMDYLRDSVRLRAFGQKDPLVEYKTEGYELFQEMMASIEDNVAQTLFRLTDPEVRRNRQIEARRGTLTMQNDPFAQIQHYTLVGADKQQDSSFASYDTSRFALAGQSTAPQESLAGRPSKERPKQTPVRHMGPQVGPNDPCPCGSGKKYKKCCGGVSRN